MEIPVYLFTGFLESGKTTFIQEALEGSDFNTGERTLLLVCEDGEVQYDSDRFFGKSVFTEMIEDEDELTVQHLSKLAEKHKVARVVIEYNGMWLLESLYRAFPQDWIIYQEVSFFDAGTFISYNENMRQFVYDKLKTPELVVFNRSKREDDKMPFHKIVRGANRKAQIIYEYGPQDAEPDTIPDPLPYDLDSDLIDIDDEYFAEWYRDINEEEMKYHKKNITIKGRVALGQELPENAFVFGRHIMTCCVDDIQFGGLLASWDKATTLSHGSWVMIEAQVLVEESPVYKGKGPVLHCKKVTKSNPANPEVATF